MAMILGKDGFEKLKVGYPTRSDKYNVEGGVFDGDFAEFGDLVVYGTTAGHYLPITGAVTVDKIAGVILATNVKLASEPEHKVLTIKGEGFNFLKDGYVALKLAKTADTASIKEGSPVCIKLEDGTLQSKEDTTKVVKLPGYFFTGIWEKKHNGDIVAEVEVIAVK